MTKPTRALFKRQNGTLIPISDEGRRLLSRIKESEACLLTIRKWSGYGKIFGFGPKTCQQCGIEFNPHLGTPGYFCSVQCLGKARAIPAIERFLQKVSPEPNSGCWLWLGAMGKNGYGSFGPGGRYGSTKRAHKFSYEHFIGKVPSGLVIRHACDVKLCVNPDHLIVGTQAENLEDAFVRGRRKRKAVEALRAIK